MHYALALEAWRAAMVEAFMELLRQKRAAELQLKDANDAIEAMQQAEQASRLLGKRAAEIAAFH
jgi:hypothetical protein